MRRVLGPCFLAFPPFVQWLSNFTLAPERKFYCCSLGVLVFLCDSFAICATAVQSIGSSRSTLALSYSLETIHSANACHQSEESGKSKGWSYRLGCLCYSANRADGWIARWLGVNLVYLLGVRNSRTEVGLYKHHHTSSLGITVVPTKFHLHKI